MTFGSLPRQILAMAAVAFIAVQIILWGSLNSVRNTMNADASVASQERMNGRLKNLQEQVSLLASDYNNWTDVFLSAQDLNYADLASNYGITAERGDVFQYAEMFDGPFMEPVSWREGQGLMPQQGFIDDVTRSVLHDEVDNLDFTARETIDYFEFRDGNLITFSGSRLLPEDRTILATIDPRVQAIAVIGKIITAEQLSAIASEFSLADMRLVHEIPSSETVGVPLFGVSQTPVAWLTWTPPQTGTALFQNMAPIVAVISVLFAAILYHSALLLHRRATQLILDEANSFAQARTDALTSLPNRLALHEHLMAIATDGSQHCALIALDLNGFKRINDNIGHSGGDHFLKNFAARLQTLVDDRTVAARLGGDEFILVVSSRNPLDHLVPLKCAELDQATREQIVFNGTAFDVMVSKGVAVMNSDEFCEDTLLRRADRALYAAKSRGVQYPVFYDERMARDDLDHQTIENNLRRAIETKEGFYVAYQPIVSANHTGTEMRFEALARWTCNECGRIAPDKFIAVAEKSGLIIRLGWLLLDLICDDIKDLPNCKVGINVSPLQLMMPGFARQFASKIKHSGVSPEQIEIEVTEQIVVRDDTTIIQELKALRQYGFSLAMDDFGTGYASIGYLTRMPFNILKIDRSFVKSRSEDDQFRRMVQSIMALAHSMDLKIIVEGIETSEEAACFRDLGADFLQGYYFGIPEQMQVRGSRQRLHRTIDPRASSGALLVS